MPTVTINIWPSGTAVRTGAPVPGPGVDVPGQAVGEQAALGVLGQLLVGPGISSLTRCDKLPVCVYQHGFSSFFGRSDLLLLHKEVKEVGAGMMGTRRVDRIPTLLPMAGIGGLLSQSTGVFAYWIVRTGGDAHWKYHSGPYNASGPINPKSI